MAFSPNILRENLGSSIQKKSIQLYEKDIWTDIRPIFLRYQYIMMLMNSGLIFKPSFYQMSAVFTI